MFDAPSADFQLETVIRFELDNSETNKELFMVLPSDQTADSEWRCLLADVATGYSSEEIENLFHLLQDILQNYRPMTIAEAESIKV